MLVVTFIGAGYIKAFVDTDQRAAAVGVGEQPFSSVIYGFSSTDQIVVVLLGFTMLMLISLLATMVVMLIKQGRVQTIRLKDTGKQPHLELAWGQKFHLFLSHIWSTGQDAVATIKRQLQRLMPDASIFLDVRW